MPRSHQRSDVGEGGDGGCMVVFGELGTSAGGPRVTGLVRDPLPDGGVLAMIGPTSRDPGRHVPGPWRTVHELLTLCPVGQNSGGTGRL